MKTQWFPTSKEVQDTEVTKQGAGACLLRQRWNSACRLSGKGASITAKYDVARHIHKLKQKLVFTRRGKLSKGILFVTYKLFIMHQKLAEIP
jgi:hypothetical protein